MNRAIVEKLSVDEPRIRPTPLELLERFLNLIPDKLANAEKLFADNFVWHYFNPALSQLEGSYNGIAGLQTFWQTLEGQSSAHIEVEVRQFISLGGELVAARLKPTRDSQATEDLIIGRVVGDRIEEAWYINTLHISPRNGESLMSRQSMGNHFKAWTTAAIWACAIGMLGVCIPLVIVTKSGVILPVLAILGSSIGTIAVWFAPDRHKEKTHFPQYAKALEERIVNLETIYTNLP